MNTKRKKKNLKGKLFLLLGLTFLIIAIISFLVNYIFSQGNILNNKMFGVIDESVLVKVDYNEVTQDTLFITPDRKQYVDGTMRLVVPRLELDTLIGDDTIPQKLEEKPGLYEFSQLPSNSDVNVSIAGHRDIGHKEFYNLHKFLEGDYVYIIYEGKVFVYEYYKSEIVEATNWDIIKRRGFSTVTLTTCDPIGTRLNRLAVVGNLLDIYEEADFNDFKINKNDM